ncbi:hypothetical protein NHX12_006622, partial [Muraenolepis orangiensis]
MAHRKRQGTSGGSNMMAAPVSGPALHSTESRDQKSPPSRPRPVRYPKDRKPLPRPSKAQYSPPKRREVSPSQPGEEQEVVVGVVNPQYYSQPEHEVEVGVVKSQYYSQPEHEVEEGVIKPQNYSQQEHEVDVGVAKPQYYSQPEQADEVGVVEPQYYSHPEQELEEEQMKPQYYSQPHEVDEERAEPQYCSQPEHEVDVEGAELQYCSPPEQEVEEEKKDGAELRYCGQPPEVQVGVGVAETQYCSQPEPALEEYRPLTPPTPEDEHVHQLPVHQLPVHQLPVHDLPATFHGADDSLDDDSSSDYMNNTSDDEVDYDEGLAEEDEGVTYYIRYCPEDDSYLEAPESSRNKPGLDQEDEEDEDGYHGDDYYAPGEEEDNGNSPPPSPFAGRRAGEGLAVGDDGEEDIDLIVAEIKMSMSMGSLSGSLSSSCDRSPEDLGPPGRYRAPPPAVPHRHDGRPKSLDLPPGRHNDPAQGLQRGLKGRSPAEEQQRWAQEQVNNRGEGPRRQQRSDLNVPLENNNVPETKKAAAFPSFVDVPGPCEPEDLIDGIIFAANYLGSTQLLSERNPSKNIRMMQAQERVQKAAKIKKKAETMMDNALRTISYIADIGNIVVLMARRRMPRTASQDCIETTPGAPEAKKQYKMICHVFESEDAFSVAYQEFLRANGINPEDLSQKQYSDVINTQEMYNDDLIHFSNSENCKELQLEKIKGEILGVVIVESGWGSILPTVILANMMNAGPAARSGKLSIGDQIMSINNTSLVGLPLATCQGIIK